jgi:hypothetical protein
MRLTETLGFKREDLYNMPYLSNPNRAYNDLNIPIIIDIPTTITTYHPARGPIFKSSLIERMPNELIMEISEHLDIRPFLNFRNTSRLMREVTYHVHVSYHCRGSNRHLRCRAQGEHGEPHPDLPGVPGSVRRQVPDLRASRPLDVPAVTRVCRRCLGSVLVTSYDTVRLASFISKAGVSEDRIRRSVAVIKGTYRNSQYNDRPRIVPCVNLNAAMLAFNVPRHTNFGEGYGHLNSRRQHDARAMVSVPLPILDRLTKVEVPMWSCKGCVQHYSLGRILSRYGAPARFTLGVPGSAVYVVRQNEVNGLFRACSRRYTASELVEHVYICAMARDIRNAFANGSTSVGAFETVYVRTGGLSMFSVNHPGGR